jgi:arylsulfatase A-like enzyme
MTSALHLFSPRDFRCSVGQHQRRKGDKPLGASGGYCRRSGDDSALFDWFDTDVPTSHPHAPVYVSPGHGAYDKATYLTQLLASRAAAVVAEHDASQAPLFLHLAFSAVHSPLVATDALLQRVSALRDRETPGYFSACGWQPARAALRGGTSGAACDSETRRVLEAMALSLDDGVGTVVDAVQAKASMWANALVAFVSDNGNCVHAPHNRAHTHSTRSAYHAHIAHAHSTRT